MNMKDDLLTQIYNILDMGLGVADAVEYPHNIISVDMNSDEVITVWAEDYDGEIYGFDFCMVK